MHILPFYLTLALTLLPATQAQAVERDVAAAEILFQKGREAMDAGDFEEACASFAESGRLDAAVGTVLNLATCEEKIGKLASAWEHWQHGLRLLEVDDQRRSFVEARIRSLEVNLPRLTIVLAKSAPQKVEIERDGVALGQAAWNVAIPVDPGSHEVVVRSIHHQARAYRIDIEQGEEKTLEVTTGTALLRLEPQNPTRTWGYVAGGVGLAGLGTALATGIMLSSTKTKVDANCPDKRCNPKGTQAVERGKALLAINTVGFIVGGVGIGTGTALFFLSSGSGRSDDRGGAEASRPRSQAGIVLNRGAAQLGYWGIF